MKISTKKIGLTFTNLPMLVEFINKDNDQLFNLVCDRMRLIEGFPESSNVPFEQIAFEFKKFNQVKMIDFYFYKSRNYFIGHNVISHATFGSYINYNTRFHSVKTNTFEDWLSNFFHELTHLVDQQSGYSFSHVNQKDIKSAPFVISGLAVELYKKHYPQSLGKV
jgi:hypothetical protein